MNHNLNLLVIEDEFQISELYRLFFGKHFNITSLEYCSDGIECFLKNPKHYDAVITDLKQEGLNGLDVVNTVYKSSNPTIPVYVVTGGDEPSIVYKIKQLVNDRYFEKPTDYVKLRDLVTSEAREIKKIRLQLLNSFEY